MLLRNVRGLVKKSVPLRQEDVEAFRAHDRLAIRVDLAQVRELVREYMGHSSLQATERYVKLLPPLDESDPAERLNAYLRRRAQ